MMSEMKWQFNQTAIRHILTITVYRPTSWFSFKLCTYCTMFACATRDCWQHFRLTFTFTVHFHYSCVDSHCLICLSARQNKQREKLICVFCSPGHFYTCYHSSLSQGQHVLAVTPIILKQAARQQTYGKSDVLL